MKVKSFISLEEALEILNNHVNNLERKKLIYLMG